MSLNTDCRDSAASTFAILSLLPFPALLTATNCDIPRLLLVVLAASDSSVVQIAHRWHDPRAPGLKSMSGPLSPSS